MESDSVDMEVRRVDSVSQERGSWTIDWDSGSKPIDLAFLYSLPSDAIATLRIRSLIVAGEYAPLLHIATGLLSLQLCSTELPDDALLYVAQLARLRVFQSWGNHFSDDGAQQLGSLRELEQLYLEEESLTLAALDFLPRLPKLSRLGISGIPATAEEVAALRAEFPDLLVDAT